jgi:formylglycine-generating enzyme required for sulfatase activity
VRTRAFGLLGLLAALACPACGEARPRPLSAETRALLERHRDLRTWEVLDAEVVHGWPRRARDPRTGITFVLVPPGEFVMGTTLAGERPEHRVRISRPFYLGETEVTVAQWRRSVEEHGGGPPKPGAADDDPVTDVSWEDASAFAALYGYRLPSEAEWEHACRGAARAGSEPWADSDVLAEHAWFGYSAGGRTHPVGTRLPNGFGLYDMLGNVAEWCADPSLGNYHVADAAGITVDPTPTEASPLRVLRGGSWLTVPPPLPSDRGADGATTRNALYGLRVLQPLP